MKLLPASPARCLASFGILALLALAGRTHAVVNLTNAGYTNDFSALPPATDWITSSSNIAGTPATFTTVNDVDTFVVTNNYNTTTLATVLGESGTNPPSVHQLARRNTALNLVQMRPRAGDPIKGANILIFKAQNGTGGLVPSIEVSYDFNNLNAGAEEVPGWNAYYSVTGNSGWTKIPEFSTATPGTLSASLDFGGAGWNSGAQLYILWVDDNGSGGDTIDASGESTYTMDNFAVTIPIVPVITAVLSNASRGLGADPLDPSDDTITFDVTVDGQNLPPSATSWTTTGPIPPVPVTGNYGDTITVPNVPLAAVPFTVSLQDQGDPSIVGNFTVTDAILPRYLALNTIDTPALVLLDGSSATQWTGNGRLMNAVLNNAGGGAIPFVASTEAINFSAGTPKFVSLTLEVEDTSAGTNFETGDIIKVELVTDAGTSVLTGLQDLNNSGFINGNTDDAGSYDLNPFLDEFNRNGVLMAAVFTNTWDLHGIIPADATTAQLVISGINDSGAEFFRIANVRFGVAVDSDGDGAYDSEEAITGTDPNDPNSLFTLLSQSCANGTYTLTVPTVTTRSYQLQTSTDLLVWTPQGAPAVGSGGNDSFDTPCDTGRKFARIVVE